MLVSRNWTFRSHLRYQRSLLPARKQRISLDDLANAEARDQVSAGFSQSNFNREEEPPKLPEARARRNRNSEHQWSKLRPYCR